MKLATSSAPYATAPCLTSVIARILLSWVVCLSSKGRNCIVVPKLNTGLAWSRCSNKSL